MYEVHYLIPHDLDKFHSMFRNPNFSANHTLNILLIFPHIEYHMFKTSLFNNILMHGYTQYFKKYVLVISVLIHVNFIYDK